MLALEAEEAGERAHHPTNVVLDSWSCEEELAQCSPVLFLIWDSNAGQLQQAGF